MLFTHLIDGVFVRDGLLKVKSQKNLKNFSLDVGHIKKCLLIALGNLRIKLMKPNMYPKSQLLFEVLEDEDYEEFMMKTALSSLTAKFILRPNKFELKRLNQRVKNFNLNREPKLDDIQNKGNVNYMNGYEKTHRKINGEFDKRNVVFLIIIYQK